MIDLSGHILLTRYRVDRLIGQGGMADVYQVWDRQRAVYLALKVLLEDLAQDPQFLRVFQNEAATLEALTHPNIVRFYGMEQSEGLVFFLMDFVSGRSLKVELLNHLGEPFSLSRVHEIMQPVCSALYFAHNRRVVHCDIKPGNILIDRDQKIFITDFGIARLAGSISSSALARVGTPAYMAPEQILGGTPTPQTDIYALGVIMFEMFSGGRRPFTGETVAAPGTSTEKVKWEHLNLAPPPIHFINPQIPTGIDTILNCCLEKDPARRYPNALELLNDLGRMAFPVKISFAQQETSLPAQGSDRVGTAAQKPIRSPEVPIFTSGTRHRNKIILALTLVSLSLAITLLFFVIVNPYLTKPAQPSSESNPINKVVILPTFPVASRKVTVMPQVTITATRGLTNIPVNKCMSASVKIQGASGNMIECVTSVAVLPKGKIQVFFSWTAKITENSFIKKYSDTNNPNMYLTDNFGNHYLPLDVGGDAGRDMVLYNGDMASGWFLFSPTTSGASQLVFHDDDKNIQTDPIQVTW